MIIAITNSLKNRASGLFIALFIGAFLLHKPAYLNAYDLYFWLGLMTLPISYKVRKAERTSRFLWPALGCALVSIPFPTTFGIYCMLVFSSVFILEQLEGKTSLLFTFHLLLLSPLFQYFNSLISFPVRLGLSNVAGSLLQLVGFDIQLSGNLINLNGIDFLVDGACAGLFMLRYSFLFGVLTLAYFQHEQKPWSLKEIMVLFSTLFVLNILGNLIRIVILIVFKVLPEYWFHETLGLIIFVLYSLLPFYLLANHWAKRKGACKTLPSQRQSYSRLFFSLVLTLLLGCFSIACWRNSHRPEKEIRMEANSHLFKKAEKVNDQIFKIRTEEALIYLKPRWNLIMQSTIP